MSLISSLIILFCLLVGFDRSPEQDFKPEFTIIQKKLEHKITYPEDEITLQRKPFSILYNSLEYDSKAKKYYATQIALTEDEENLKMIYVGADANKVDCFMPGTGYAANEPYDCFTIQSDFHGHQYIYYETDGYQRAVLVDEKEGLLRLRSDIRKLRLEKDIIRIQKYPGKGFYLILFNDVNLNDIMEEGEFSVVTIHFK